MNDRFNTIAGWTLFGGIVALGLSTISSHYFLADKHEAPEKMGYAVVGAADGAGAAAVVAPIANRLAKADAAKGEAIFAKCKACHTIDQGAANGIGPNLWGVNGDGIGQGRGGFAFSDSLKAKGGKVGFRPARYLADQPQGVCRRHENVVCRPAQPRRSRERDPVSELQGVQPAPAAASCRSGCCRRRPVLPLALQSLTPAHRRLRPGLLLRRLQLRLAHRPRLRRLARLPRLLPGSKTYLVSMIAPLKPLPFRGGVGVGPIDLARRRAWGEAPPPAPPLKGRGADSYMKKGAVYAPFFYACSLP